jgi:hypothetical protein
MPGSAVVGGYVYRGEAIPSLKGTYIYGDWGTGKIWGAASGEILAGAAQSVLLGAIDGGRLTSFGQDEASELYVVDGADGRILSITAAETSAP